MISLRDRLEGRAVVDGGLDHEDLLARGGRCRRSGSSPDRASASGRRSGSPSRRPRRAPPSVPRRPGSPRIMGPLWTKRPSDSVRTTPVTREGRPVALVDLAADVERDAAAHARLHARGAPRRGPRGRPRRPSARPPAPARGGSRCRRPPRRRPYCRPCRRARWGGRRRRAPSATASGTGSAVCDELVAVLPRHAGEPLGQRLGQGLIVVRDDVDAEAGLGDVGEREAREDRDRDDRRDPSPSPRPGRRGGASGPRAVPWLPSGGRSGGLRKAAVGRMRPAMTSASAHRRLDAALGHVHVRVGLVAVEEVGARAPWPRRGCRGSRASPRWAPTGPTAAAHGRDQVALAVVQALGAPSRRAGRASTPSSRPAAARSASMRSLTWLVDVAW